MFVGHLRFRFAAEGAAADNKAARADVVILGYYIAPSHLAQPAHAEWLTSPVRSASSAKLPRILADAPDGGHGLGTYLGTVSGAGRVPGVESCWWVSGTQSGNAANNGVAFSLAKRAPVGLFVQQ